VGSATLPEPIQHEARAAVLEEAALNGAPGLGAGLRGENVCTWYPSDECRIRKVFVCQTMVKRIPIRLPVRKGAFSFVPRLSFVRETFVLGDPTDKAF